MRRIIITAVLLTAAAFSSFAVPIPERSVLPLRLPDGSVYCTGFVIDAIRKYVLTADHCISSFAYPFVNGQQSSEIFHVPELDVAILDAPGINSDAYTPALTGSTWGSEVTAIGFPGPNQLMRKYKTMLPEFSIPETPGRWFAFKPDVLPGMSGGPVLNESGKVVAVVQMTDTDLGYSISRKIEDIFPATAPYWQYQPE